MPPTKIEKEIQGFLGHLQNISCFLYALTMVCEPIFKKFKKGIPSASVGSCATRIPLIVHLTATTTAVAAMLA